MNWDKIIGDQVSREIRLLVIGMIIILGGVVSEIVARFSSLCIHIAKYDEICMSILAVQGTVVVLVITVLALLNNHTSERYLGIGINDYILDKKPIIFKQVRIINVEFILLIINFFLLMREYYNAMISVSFVSIFLVWISVYSIYLAFTDGINVKKEISAYFFHILEYKKN